MVSAIFTHPTLSFTNIKICGLLIHPVSLFLTIFACLRPLLLPRTLNSTPSWSSTIPGTGVLVSNSFLIFSSLTMACLARSRLLPLHLKSISGGQTQISFGNQHTHFQDSVRAGLEQRWKVCMMLLRREGEDR